MDYNYDNKSFYKDSSLSDFIPNVQQTLLKAHVQKNIAYIIRSNFDTRFFREKGKKDSIHILEAWVSGNCACAYA
jgi:hypothetical protein